MENGKLCELTMEIYNTKMYLFLDKNKTKNIINFRIDDNESCNNVEIFIGFKDDVININNLLFTIEDVSNMIINKNFCNPEGTAFRNLNILLNSHIFCILLKNNLKLHPSKSDNLKIDNFYMSTTFEHGKEKLEKELKECVECENYERAHEIEKLLNKKQWKMR